MVSYTIENTKLPFDCLGFKGEYMFFNKHISRGKLLYKVKNGKLTKKDLLFLAPLDIWETYYGKETKFGVSIAWDHAINDINMQMYAVGFLEE